jgi:hypothetical protein
MIAELVCVILPAEYARLESVQIAGALTHR